VSLQISWATEENLFEGSGVVVPSQVFHLLEFDCVLSESHDAHSEVTEHAVESGAPISDHKRATPRRLTIEGFVTNTPLDAPPSSGAGETTITTSVSQDGAQVRVFSEEFDRIRDVWDVLERLRLDAIPVGITTTWRDYEDVQIVGVMVKRDSPEGAVPFMIECVEVRIARTREVDDPVALEPRGAGENNRGAREGEDAENTAPVSVLNGIVDAATEYFR